MKMIVGLGNPGADYVNTRHNMGFEAMDALAEKLGAAVRVRQRLALTGQCVRQGERLLLVKPLTYMNLSGDCVRLLSDYYRIAPGDILVLCDDIHLPLGQLRVRRCGSDGGHKGLRSIISRLGSDAFPRIRCGAGPVPPEMDLVHFVLSHYDADERKIARAEQERAAEAALCFLDRGAEAAMNAFNQRVEKHGEEL